MNNKIIQLICPDQKGIIAKLTSIIHDSNNNILSIEQHVDNENNSFYIIQLTNTVNTKQIIKKNKNEYIVINASITME